MNKETKILVGVGAVIAAYLILKPKKAVAQKNIVSTPKIVQSPSKVQTPSNVQLENMPIVKQTPFIPTLPKPGGALTKESVEQQQNSYMEYLANEIKARKAYVMTKEELAECLKDGSKCKF
jgi:hypothetical protein